MQREWETQRGALATVRRFNATISAKGYVWSWPRIAAALTSKHHWLIIACDSCGTVVDLDLSPAIRKIDLRCVARYSMSALQWAWLPAHYRDVGASLDLKPA